ncbi:MAG: hypothetical protein ACM358_14100 [Gemmatimonadota bacterium]
MTDDDDDEKTPPRQPTPKPYRMTDSERDARRHGRQWPRGVPVVRPEPSDEVTAPIELLLNGAPDVEDYAQIEALRRSEADLHRLVLNLAKALARYRGEERSGSKAIEKQVIAAIDETQRQLGELASRVDAAAARAEVATIRTELGERHTETKGSIHENLSKLLGTRSTARWLLGIALTAALSSVTFVVASIRSSGADAIRLGRNERDIEQCQQDIRDIRRELRRKDTP